MNDEQLIALMAAVIYGATLAKEGAGSNAVEIGVREAAVDAAEWIANEVHSRSDEEFRLRALSQETSKVHKKNLVVDAERS